MVMGKNYSNESELLNFPALNQSMSSENVSENGVLEEGLEAKGQLISKADLKVLIWTKNQRKYFCISALASKMSQLKNNGSFSGLVIV